MESFFYGYWWLIFPIMFFVFGAFDRWLSYKRSQERMALLREYTAQGKDPPPELIRTINDEEALDDPDSAYGSYDRYGRHARRYHRRYWRHGPYWAWRTAIITGSVAVGFWFAAEYADFPAVDGPFRLVAVIMSCVAVGHLIAAIFSTVFRSR